MVAVKGLRCDMNAILVLEFLKYVEGLPYSGLLVMDDARLEKRVSDLLRMKGYQRASNWQDALACLNSDQSTFVVFRSPLSREEYELVAQHAARCGAIQIKDKSSLQFHSAFFSPYETHLIILTDKFSLQEIERTHTIKDKVGLIERVEYVDGSCTSAGSCI